MSKAITENEKVRLDSLQAISRILAYCRNHSYGLAIWRDPLTGTTQGVIDFYETEYSEKVLLEEMESGFLFAPYNRNDNPHFIKACVHFVIDSELEFLSGGSYEIQKIREALTKTSDQTSGSTSLNDLTENGREQQEYINLVERAVEAIHAGKFIKVVPSRSRTCKIGSLDIPGLFMALKKTYSNAFVSITSTPEHGIWMGASPELLVRLTEGRFFETIALAGTQPYREEVSPGDVAWTQKEIEEQALVSRYIINCFKKIRLREFEEAGPKTVAAGNLIHLKTRFIVDMEATGFSNLGSVMLELLHPTSAICGMPLDAAEKWLKENERYDREFFSGYLGPVNIQDQTSLFVNLRCMKIDNSSVRFFAGAGVTEDSRPEKEWLETEMKMNTLLNVIREHTTDL